jgi:cardiolipin synthase
MDYFTDVETAWEAIYQDCLRAEKSIRFEQFILRDFNPGSVGDRFVQMFIKKAEAGVKIRLMLDIVGSYHILRSPCLKKMRSAGIKVRFTSLQFLRIRDILDWTPRRNHRKLAVIDDDTAYIGGVVFSDSVKSWNDFHVRITGAGRMFMKAFEMIWSSQTMKSSFQMQSGRYDVPISLIGNEHANNILYKAIKKRIKRARRDIEIVTPYFSPGRKLRNLLIKASKRGVKIRIVIPKRTDQTLAQLAHISYIPFAKRANISLMAASKMNHAKIIRIDDWLTFGSSNFDRLSLFYNKELNVQTEDPTLVHEIQEVAINPFFADTEPFVVAVRKLHSFKIERFLLGIVGYIVRPIV